MVEMGVFPRFKERMKKKGSRAQNELSDSEMAIADMEELQKSYRKFKRTRDYRDLAEFLRLCDRILT